MSESSSTPGSAARASVPQRRQPGLPALAQSLFRRALSFVGTPRKHWSSLQRLYEWILRAGPDHFGAHYNYARNLQQHGKYEEAAKHYRKAIALNPDFVEAHDNLGIVLCEMGHYVEAEAAFAQALELRDYAHPHCNLGELFLRQGRLDAAEAELLTALEMQPDFVDAVYTYAQVLTKMERFEEAEDRYRQALALEPDDAEIHEDFAEFLIQRGRLQEGKHHLEKAVELRLAAKPGSSPLDEWEQQSRAYYRQQRRGKNYGGK